MRNTRLKAPSPSKVTFTFNGSVAGVPEWRPNRDAKYGGIRAARVSVSSTHSAGGIVPTPVTRDVHRSRCDGNEDGDDGGDCEDSGGIDNITPGGAINGGEKEDDDGEGIVT